MVEWLLIQNRKSMDFPYDIDGYFAYESDFIEQIYKKTGINKEGYNNEL